MKPGDLVRMEFPVNAYEDRFTGREFEVVDVVKGPEGASVVVQDDAGNYRFRRKSLVRVPGVTAKEILAEHRRRRRRS